MECVKCQRRTVRRINEAYICQAEDCNYRELEPLSYAPEQVTCRDEDKQSNLRPSYHNSYPEQSSFDLPVKKCRIMINDACHLLKYSEMIANLAMKTANLAIKEEFQQRKQSINSQESSVGKTFESWIKKLVTFSIVAACSLRCFYLEEYKIVFHFGFTVKQWRGIVFRFVGLVKPSKNLCFLQTPEYLLKKMCESRRIRVDQREAMVQLCGLMVKEIQNKGKTCKDATVACVAFWKVCQMSSEYHQVIKLEGLCSTYEKLVKEKDYLDKLNTHFDIGAESVRKLSREFFSKMWIDKHMPCWEGRFKSNESSVQTNL